MLYFIEIYIKYYVKSLSQSKKTINYVSSHNFFLKIDLRYYFLPVLELSHKFSGSFFP